jgi:hypothetical protein
MEASIEMARKLALGRESGHGVNAGAGARYQAARIVSPPPGSAGQPCSRRSVSLHHLAGRAVIAGAGAIKAR